MRGFGSGGVGGGGFWGSGSLVIGGRRGGERVGQYIGVCDPAVMLSYSLHSFTVIASHCFPAVAGFVDVDVIFVGYSKGEGFGAVER